MADDKTRLFLMARIIPIGLAMHEVIASAWVRFSHEAMRLKIKVV
jgi:hypothetical protein